MQTLVDTSVWLDYFEGRATAQTEWLDLALGHVGMVVGSRAPDLLWEPLAGWLSRTAASC